MLKMLAVRSVADPETMIETAPSAAIVTRGILMEMATIVAQSGL
jgi:hypothetical protein